MAVPVDAIRDHLLATPAIQAIVGNRVFTFDPTRFSNPALFDPQSGDVLPGLAIDDQEGFAIPNAPNGAYQMFVAVWGIVPKTDEGIAQLRTLIPLVVGALHEWIDPVSRAQMFWSNNRGEEVAEVTGGVTNYARFGLVGIHQAIAAREGV